MAEVKARVTEHGVQINVQSHGDADVDVWAAERKVELFENVFGRKVQFSARNTAAQSNGKGRPHAGQPRRRRTNQRRAGSKSAPRAATRHRPR